MSMIFMRERMLVNLKDYLNEKNVEREALVVSHKSKAERKKMTLKFLEEAPMDITLTHHMNELREVTVSVIEGIASWSKSVTAPLPLLWKGENYILKIIVSSAASLQLS